VFPVRRLAVLARRAKFGGGGLAEEDEEERTQGGDAGGDDDDVHLDTVLLRSAWRKWERTVA